MSSEASTLFSSLAIRPELLQSLATSGYEQLTPVQRLSISPMLSGRDVLAQAETGSGKTAAFAITVLNKLDSTSLRTQALIICPTRELSDQVAAEIRKLASAMSNTRVVTLCGGKPMHDQLTALKREPHVIVGTPGRLINHLGKGTLRLENIQTLVLDEADRMLDMGFYDDITHILNATESDRQTLLFSATYSDDILRVSKAVQQEPAVVQVEPSTDNARVEQVFVFADRSQKLYCLRRTLSDYKPENAIIFCNRKDQVQNLCNALCSEGLPAKALHGDLDQRERDESLILFANDSVSLLIATDVAARGLDISALAAVINYDLPPDPETYLHRIGRTARAGREGLAVSFVEPDEMPRVRVLEKYLNADLPFRELKNTRESKNSQMPPRTQTLLLNLGKKDKIRPGDIVGAITADSSLTNDDIGKITVLAKAAYVAIAHDKAEAAMTLLMNGRIKKQKVRVKLLRV